MSTDLSNCIHCGLCLDVCPTYALSGDEAESPRGRLMLLDLIERGDRSLDRGPVDRCLGCRSCETTCPSGVAYGEILEHGRERLGPPSATPMERWVAWSVDHVISHPRRAAPLLRLASRLAQSPVRRLLPLSLREFFAGVDTIHLPGDAGLPATGRTGLLAGCAQSILSAQTLPALAKLVNAAGGDACVPRAQGCCGALSAHQGSMDVAREFARANIRAFDGVEELVVPSAGCSAHMRNYGHLLAADPEYAERARALAERVSDAVDWLGSRGEALKFHPDRRRVAYHTPCHHSHAQALGAVAPQLLSRIEGLLLLLPEDPDRCCGSAGSYSLLEPATAKLLRENKLDDLLRDGPQLVLTANPGCEFHLRSGRSTRNLPELRHIVDYLSAQLVVSPPLETDPKLK